MTGADTHPLAVALHEAVSSGVFPPVDGVVEVVPPDPDGSHAVVEFTGHSYVLTDRSPDDPVFAGVDAFGAATHPAFVLALAGTDATIGSHDAVLVRRGDAGAGGGPAPLPETTTFDDHPRVVRARHHRREVGVFGDERGLVTIGRGLVGRTELSVELTGSVGGAGEGRSLVLGGLARVPVDEFVFAQVSPGNAASLRAFLACGFVPVGSEILFEPAATPG